MAATRPSAPGLRAGVQQEPPGHCLPCSADSQGLLRSSPNSARTRVLGQQPFLLPWSRARSSVISSPVSPTQPTASPPSGGVCMTLAVRVAASVSCICTPRQGPQEGRGRYARLYHPTQGQQRMPGWNHPGTPSPSPQMCHPQALPRSLRCPPHDTAHLIWVGYASSPHWTPILTHVRSFWNTNTFSE